MLASKNCNAIFLNSANIHENNNVYILLHSCPSLIFAFALEVEALSFVSLIIYCHCLYKDTICILAYHIIPV